MRDAYRERSGTASAWYALYTRPRHEKKVERQLKERGIESYLPLKKTLHQWSDRKKWVEEPLFRCYVFVRTADRDRMRSLHTYGSVRFVSFDGKPAVVRDEEIHTIKCILREMPTSESYPDVTVGDVVEIVHGPLTGMRGKLEEIRSGRRLIVAIPSIHQALRFSLDGLDVRPVN